MREWILVLQTEFGKKYKSTQINHRNGATSNLKHVSDDISNTKRKYSFLQKKNTWYKNLF